MFRNSVLEDEQWIRPGSALARLGAAQGSGTARAQLWYLVVLESWLRHERGLVVNREAIAQVQSRCAREAHVAHIAVLRLDFAKPPEPVGLEHCYVDKRIQPGRNAPRDRRSQCEP